MSIQSNIRTATPPFPYQSGPAGFYHLIPSKDGDATEEWMCSEFSVLGTGCDSAGKNWGRVVEVVDPDQSTHRLFITLAELSGPAGKVLGRLSDNGLRYPRGKVAREGILDLLDKWEGANRFLVTHKKGWASPTCDAFVVDSSYTLGTRDVFFMGHTDTRSTVPSASGDIKFWKTSVAQKCVGNPILLSAVSLAFCGPLLDILEIDSFGLHLRGSSSCGKSTALNTAMSVWGGPEKMSTWRTTANALEATASNMNSTLLALDELGLVTGKDAFDAVYTLGNGQGKRRANATGNAAPSMNWRVPILSSGEITLADKIAESGQKVMTGQEVRVIDVAADIGKFGVFQNIHGATSAAAFSEELKDATKNVYGVAGHLFVNACLRYNDALKPILQRNIKAITQRLLGRLAEPADGPTQRVAASFALLGLAGELASKWDLTGWATGSAISAAGSLLEAWVDRRSADTDATTLNWIPMLNMFLENTLEDGFTFICPAALSNAFGFWDDGSLYLKESAWSTAFGPANRTTAAKALADQGILVRDGKHYKTKAPSVIGNRDRCYRLRRTLLADKINALIQPVEKGGLDQAA
jgi:putative DNA primase/helicase